MGLQLTFRCSISLKPPNLHTKMTFSKTHRNNNHVQGRSSASARHPKYQLKVSPPKGHFKANSSKFTQGATRHCDRSGNRSRTYVPASGKMSHNGEHYDFSKRSKIDNETYARIRNEKTQPRETKPKGIEMSVVSLKDFFTGDPMKSKAGQDPEVLAILAMLETPISGSRFFGTISWADANEEIMFATS